MIQYRPRKYLSVSTLVDFARCPRRYFYRKCGLQPATDLPPLAPTYGSAMHVAVPIALETEDLAKSLSGFMSEWGPIADKMEELGETDKKRNVRCAERSLRHFIFTHSGNKSLYRLAPPPDGTLESDERTSSFEVPWAIDVGLSVPLVGRFDGFCTHRDTGETWIWELKTTSRLDGRFFEAHEMYTQNLVYTLVGQTLLNAPVAGVMVEGILVAASKVDNQTHPLPVREHHLQDVLTWVQRTGNRLLGMERDFHRLTEIERKPIEEAASAFYKDFTGCTPYTHFYMPGYRCEYATLCREDNWPALLPMYEITEEHDFLAVTINDDAKKPSTTSPSV